MTKKLAWDDDSSSSQSAEQMPQVQTALMTPRRSACVDDQRSPQIVMGVNPYSNTDVQVDFNCFAITKRIFALTKKSANSISPDLSETSEQGLHDPSKDQEDESKLEVLGIDDIPPHPLHQISQIPLPLETQTYNVVFTQGPIGIVLETDFFGAGAVVREIRPQSQAEECVLY